MARVFAQAERTIPATPREVFAFLSDYGDSRQRILTSHFADFTVEEGGQGSGTVVSYRLRAGQRERFYRMRVEVPTDGELLREVDTESSLVNTWSVSAIEGGAQSKVALSTEWQGVGGIRGFFERTFAPLALRRIYSELLSRLEQALAGHTS